MLLQRQALEARRRRIFRPERCCHCIASLSPPVRELLREHPYLLNPAESTFSDPIDCNAIMIEDKFIQSACACFFNIYAWTAINVYV